MPALTPLKVAFITALDFFEIKELSKEPEEINDNLFLTNNKKHFSSFFTEKHIKNLGSLEYLHLTSGRPVIFSTKNFSTPFNPDTELLDFLREVQGFLYKTWLWKDNSANCQLAFALGTGFDLTSSNCLPVFNSSASGENKALKITLKEAKELKNKYGISISAIKEKNFPEDTALKKHLGRLTVANHHIREARNNRDIGFKIANYCSFFETLFSTDSSELSHQLSQRVSFFLSKQPTERIHHYTLLKKAYSIRSKAVHGDMLDSKQKELKKISQHCDQLARDCLIKISKSTRLSQLFNNGSRNEISNFLLEVIFDINTTEVI
ncbi:hypothetical protein FZZ93_07450 [Halomonas eurihalina]|uniref:Uncharacterized protein n=1 Tax=Halomonas eurihalina TaxID=42566 RepID=A0A5D9DBQ3_HALER|nr:HEPN domain-containing protein [Halomonas eurihalina]MDR5860702.1 HEPN domain-containing protein [Halomonas eurihalina]TZG40075.1 hypothetical protein FZZ93_07450 [Halomonas eurihalina]